MAVNVHCIVNVSLCNLVKMYENLRFCSLAAPYLNVFTSAMASAGLSALGSTWLKTTWTTVWGQPETPASDQCSAAPLPAPLPRPGLRHTQGSVLPALSASPSFKLRLGEPSSSLLWVELCHASHPWIPGFLNQEGPLCSCFLTSRVTQPVKPHPAVVTHG